MTIQQLCVCIAEICATFIMLRAYDVELCRELMMFQQNSYRYERYRRWLSQSGDTTTTIRLCAYALFLLSLSKFATGLQVGVSLLIIIFSTVYLLKARKIHYKKPLVMTKRATRIYIVSIIIPLLIAVGLFIIDVSTGYYYSAIVFLGFFCGSNIMVMASNYVLTPIEKHITGKYYRDARKRLEAMPDLKIIGITGSYGKTSTKHYLERIIAEKYSVTMTPGSFNTTLGVVRTIRENLKPYDEVFIVEMGAKNRGDIKEICDLVHPHIGIVTAVGPQHLESFKTIENVQATKFELIDSLPDNGLAIVNDDFPYIANRPVENCKCLRYAINDTAGASYIATDIEVARSGCSFTLNGPDGYTCRFNTRLLGACNISNLMGAIIAARAIGVEDAKIKKAVSDIAPVEHRLSLKTTPGGITIIDDAFNSNPGGSAMALDVLAMMSGGKRIIITPGMIELGSQQHELNAQFGNKIARCADVAIVVGEYNRDAIKEGIEAVDNSVVSQVHYVATFAEAQTLLKSLCTAGDTVLYENDLPDTFK